MAFRGEHREISFFERPESGDPDITFRQNIPEADPGISWNLIGTAPTDDTRVWLLVHGQAVQGNRLSPEFAFATHWALITGPQR